MNIPGLLSVSRVFLGDAGYLEQHNFRCLPLLGISSLCRLSPNYLSDKEFGVKYHMGPASNPVRGPTFLYRLSAVALLTSSLSKTPAPIFLLMGKLAKYHPCPILLVEESCQKLIPPLSGPVAGGTHTTISSQRRVLYQATLSGRIVSCAQKGKADDERLRRAVACDERSHPFRLYTIM